MNRSTNGGTSWIDAGTGIAPADRSINGACPQAALAGHGSLVIPSNDFNEASVPVTLSGTGQ